MTPDTPHPDRGGSGRSVPPLAAFLSVFFVFACFFPTPALPIAANTGLQAGQFLALLALPLLLLRGLPHRQTLALALLFLPVLVSGFATVISGRALSDAVALNSVAVFLLILLVLLPAGRMANERYVWRLLSGVALAVVTHAVVGAYQVYAFSRGVFPLLGLYQNPSYKSNDTLQAGGEVWATYVQRPFGLFPEPSALTASIGPWLILFVGLLLYPRLRVGIGRGTMLLLAVATLSGVALVLVSRSGYTVALVAGLLLVSLPALRRNLLRLHRPEALFTLILLTLAGLAVAILAVAYLGPRFEPGQNASWTARLSSYVWGISYLGTSPSNFLFGVGPGQSFLTLQSSDILGPLPEGPAGQSVDAVWSAMVVYIQETGLLGILALALLMTLVLRAVARSSARLIGFTCLGAWTFGIVLTTSYPSLLPVWLFLGVLLSWDRIFVVRRQVSPGASGAIEVRSAPGTAGRMKVGA
jgi:hypothetical protein